MIRGISIDVKRCLISCSNGVFSRLIALFFAILAMHIENGNGTTHKPDVNHHLFFFVEVVVS